MISKRETERGSFSGTIQIAEERKEVWSCVVPILEIEMKKDERKRERAQKRVGQEG